MIAKYTIKPYALIIFLIVFSFVSKIGLAQNWQWADKISGTLDNVSRGLVVDTEGNVYVYAQIKGTASVGSDNFVTSGTSDALLVKFDPNGNYIWGLQLGGNDQETPTDIAIDDNNNIYVTGGFKGTAEFNPINPGGSGELINSDPDGGNKNDIFLAKYTSDGNFEWVYQVSTGANNEFSRSIALDINNDILLVGDFKSEIVFNLTDTISSTGSNQDIFAIKISQVGSPTTIWNKHFPTSADNGKFLSVDASQFNNIFVGGYFTDKLFYETDSCVSQGSTDLVLFKLDSDGNTIWVRQGGGSALDQINTVLIDEYENVYFTGYFSTTAYFDVNSKGAYDSSPLISNGGYDILIGKYNRTGDLQFVSGNGDASNDIGYGLTTRKNLIEFSGYYSGTIIVNNDTLVSDLGNNDTGYLVYDTDGNPIEAHGMYGNLDDRGLSVMFNSSGSSFVTGYFQSDTLYIGSEILVNATDNLSPKRKDVFISKYDVPFKISITYKQNVQCYESSDGMAVVTPYFGTPPYIYSWSYDDGLANDTLLNVPAGNYWVKVTDGNSKSDSVAFSITQPDSIGIIGTFTDVTCNGNTNGTISLTISGGTVSGDYTYQWNTNDGSGLSQGVKDQVSLSAGTYDLIVTDDNGCTANESFVINQPLPFSFAGSLVDDVLTPPGNNGGIDLNVSIAVTPLTYSWTGPGGFSSNAEDLTNLGTGGSYTVVVTDANMCTGDTTFFVNDADAFLVFVSDQTNVTCFGGSDGSVTVSTSGGTAPFTYIWRDEFADPVGSDDPTLSGVSAGTYYVRVDDSGGEFYILSVLITEPTSSVQAIVSAINDVNCAGNSDGSIDVIVSGGSLPYTYAWTGPNGYTAALEDIANLEAGDYTLVVTDANGCTGGLTDLTVSEPSPLVLTVDINSDILCNGDFGGELEAIVAGGTSPYSYLWNDQGNQTTKRATTLPAGYYSVIVTDANGCIVQANESLIEPDQISVSVLKQDVSCNGANDGFISLTVTGGTAPFSYLWSPISEITKDITDLSGGDYTVNITDANNCTWDTTITILEADAILINSVTVTDVTGCFGSDNGSIEIDAIGGAVPLEYSIDDGATWQASNLFTDIGGGTYPISVRDVNACLVTDNPVAVVEPEAIVFSTIVTNLSCYGAADGNIEITVASGGIAPFEYSIDGGTTFQAGSSFADLLVGDYDVIVMGSDGCLSPGSTVTVAEPLEIVILSGETTSTCLGESQGTVLVTAEGGTGDLSYVLKLNGSEVASNSDGNFTGLDVGNYIVDVFDDNDCGPVSSSPLEVTQSPTYDCAIDIYNAFSPNNDGINDRWNIYRIENYPNAVVKVYNNWGTIVFTSSAGYPTPWDGTFNGKALPAGTYYYIIDLDNGEQPKSGTVNIIK